MNEILKMFIDTLHLTNEYLIVKIYFHNKLKKNLKLLTRATQGGIVFSKQANKQYTPGGIHPKPRGNTGKTTFPQTPRSGKLGKETASVLTIYTPFCFDDAQNL